MKKKWQKIGVFLFFLPLFSLFPITDELKKEIKNTSEETSSAKYRFTIFSNAHSLDYDIIDYTSPNVSSECLKVLLEFIDQRLRINSSKWVSLIEKVNAKNYSTFKKALDEDKQFKLIFNDDRQNVCNSLEKNITDEKTKLKKLQLTFLQDAICKKNIFSLIKTSLDSSIKNNDLNNLEIIKVLFMNPFLEKDVTNNIQEFEDICNKIQLFFSKKNLFDLYNQKIKKLYFNIFKKFIVPNIKHIDAYKFFEFYNIRQTLKKIDPKKETTPNNSFKDKCDQLDKITKQLLKEFVNWDDTIYRVMSAIRMVALNPEHFNRPIVIPLISLPGYGKTTLIQRIVELMKWNGKFRQYILKPNSITLPIDDLKKVGEVVGKETNEIQQVVLYEEIQNLVPYEELLTLPAIEKENEKGKEKEPKLFYSDNDRKKRRESIDFLWQMLGNGIIVDHTNNPPQYYLKLLEKKALNIISTSEEVRTNKSMLSELTKKLNEMETTKMTSEKALDEIKKTQELYLSELIQKGIFTGTTESLQTLFYEKKFDKIKDSFPTTVDKKQADEIVNKMSEYHKLFLELYNKQKRANENFDDYTKRVKDTENKLFEAQFKIEDIENDYEFISLLSTIRDEMPDLLEGKTSYKERQQFIKNFVEDPGKTLEHLKDLSNTISEDKMVNYKRIIIFITGNPTKIINQIKNDYKNISENQIDPDALSKNIEDTIHPDALRHWFREIFGTNQSGLESRFRLGAWNLIRPFNNKQWADLISKRLESYEKTFTEFAHKMNVSAKIEFDSTVHDLLFREGVAPFQGPRELIDTDKEIFETFITDLASKIADGPSIQHTTFHVSYVEKEKKHFLVANNYHDFVIEIPFGISRQHSESKLSSEEGHSQLQRLHLAAYVLVGTEQFGSVPKYVENIDIDSLSALYRLWPEPSSNIFELKKKIVITLLSAPAVEFVEMLGHFKSDKIFVVYPVVKKILSDIRLNFNSARTALNFSENEEIHLKDLLPEKLSNDPFFIEIDQGNFDKVIDLARSEAIKILRKNRKMISAIGNHLEGQKGITGETIKELYRLNLRTAKPFDLLTWFYDLLTNAHTKKSYIYDPQLIPILSNKPGSVGKTSLEVFDIPYKKPKPSSEYKEDTPSSFMSCLGDFCDILHRGYSQL